MLIERVVFSRFSLIERVDLLTFIAKVDSSHVYRRRHLQLGEAFEPVRHVRVFFFEFVVLPHHPIAAVEIRLGQRQPDVPVVRR